MTLLHKCTAKTGRSGCRRNSAVWIEADIGVVSSVPSGHITVRPGRTKRLWCPMHSIRALLLQPDLPFLFPGALVRLPSTSVKPILVLSISPHDQIPAAIPQRTDLYGGMGVMSPIIPEILPRLESFKIPFIHQIHIRSTLQPYLHRQMPRCTVRIWKFDHRSVFSILPP